jgi:hypothetical protein
MHGGKGSYEAYSDLTLIRGYAVKYSYFENEACS